MWPLEPKQQWSLGQKARTVYTELCGMADLLQFAIVSWDLFMLWEYKAVTDQCLHDSLHSLKSFLVFSSEMGRNIFKKSIVSTPLSVWKTPFSTGYPRRASFNFRWCCRTKCRRTRMLQRSSWSLDNGYGSDGERARRAGPTNRRGFQSAGRGRIRMRHSQDPFGPRW